MLLKKLARRVLKAKTSLKLTRSRLIQSRFRIWEALEAKFDDFEMYVKNL
jgi:hypothetical protein